MIKWKIFILLTLALHDHAYHEVWHIILFFVFVILCLLRGKFWAGRQSKNDLTFEVCKVIYRCKRLVLGAEHQPLRFLELQIVSGYYIVRDKKFHSINKASNGARSFPYADFSFSHRFLFTLCHTIHPIRLVHHQKSINHKSNSLVITFSFLYNFLFFVWIHICRFNAFW